MKKLILIDDNKDILTMWKMFLERQGFEPVTLESGKEFYAYLDENPTLEGIGCIVSDESLKDDLGSNLFQKVQEKEIRIPFIIISGYSEAEISSKVSSPEKLQILKKPISLQQLKEVIDASFDGESISY
ncbi:MAG: response regulator [Bacteriovoracaceae bacterium]|nr:response regulator [Bacteriovoracaceae bacterium]